MPVEDIDKGHKHLLPKDRQQPNPERRGVFSLLFGFLRKNLDERWTPKAPSSENWQSERGTWDTSLPYNPGKPQKKAKAATAPLEKHPSEHFDKALTHSVCSRFQSIEALESTQYPAFKTSAEQLLDVLKFLRDEASPNYSWPQHVTAIDWPDDEQLELVYALRSTESGKLVSVHLRVPRIGAHVPSSAHLFAGFNWHEREVFELYRVTFDNHPDLRPLLLDSTYTEPPMLKGYTDEEREFVVRPY